MIKHIYRQGEIAARYEAEKRLREAEVSLTRLEKAVETNMTTNDEKKTEEEKDQVKEEMIADVNTLKSMSVFFKTIKIFSPFVCYFVT